MRANALENLQMKKGICASLLVIFLMRIQICSAVEMTVVGIFEEDYPLAKHVVDKMFELFAGRTFPGDTFRYQNITIQSGDTDASVCERLRSFQPTVVIDTTRRPTALYNRAGNIVKKVTRQLGIPTVSGTYGAQEDTLGWEKLDPNEIEYLIQIAPPGSIIPQVVRDLANAKNLTSSGVLFQDIIDMDNKSAILLQNIATRSIISTITTDRESIRTAAQGMKTGNIQYFFVVGTVAAINVALDVAETSNMTGLEFAWIFISMGSEQPGCRCTDLTALWLSPRPTPNKKSTLDMIMREFQYPSQVEVAFYYDLVLLVISAIRRLKIAGTWPDQISYPSCDSRVSSADRSSIKLRTALKEEGYEGIFGKFVIQHDVSKKNYEGVELFVRKMTFLANEATNLTRLGVWDYGTPTGTFEAEVLNHPEFKKFTAKTVYRVTTIIIPPFVEKRRNEDGTEYFTGYCVELLDAIKEELQFEYTIKEAYDKKYGSMNEKLEWNGMMRELIDKIADIALGPISVMAERETVVDFTVPYYDLVGISILMKKPSVPSSLFKFLTVLEANVWGCILAAYFFTSFLMYLFDRLSPYSFYNNKEKYADDDEDEKRDFSLKESLWFCMTSLTPQGGGEAPRNLSGRLVAATWWLFGFIIIASYTANLAAFLTVSRLDSPIESLDDLAKQYKIKYAPQKGTSAATYFERMAYIEGKFYEIWKNMSLDDTLNETERAKLAVWDYPVSDKYTKIWWTMVETKLPETFQDGLDRVFESKGSQDGFAFIADATEVKYAVMTNCSLIQVGSEFSRKPLALAVQQGSPLKDLLSSAILKLLNQRKLESLKENWWNRNPAKVECDDSEQQSDGISIANIGGVFIVIFIGVVLACITLATEYWFYRRKKQKNSRVVTVKQYPQQKNRNRR